MRWKICMKLSASYADFMMRSIVWQPLQLSRNRFCSSVPGMLHPFGIGQVGGEIFHFPELDVGAGHAARGDVRGRRAVELVARRARLQAVVSRLEPRGRKSEAPLSVRDDADADRRAVPLGADDDAFHRPFFG